MKRCALKRRVSIRDSYLKKLKARGGRTIYNKRRNGKLHRVKPFTVRKPLKKVSRALRSELQKYFKLTTAFLLKPENRLCQICLVRREHGENILIQIATEVHHFRGRIGRLLCWVPGFRPSCYGCRLWPHDHPKQAREWGLIAPAAAWNALPGNGSD